MTPPERYPRRPLQPVDIENSELTAQERLTFMYIEINGLEAIVEPVSEEE